MSQALALERAPNFRSALERRGLGPLRREAPRVVQINLGRRCNQACQHCHVEAGPTRTEAMERSTAERILALLAASPGIETVDLTGGAPELNPNFRLLVSEARRLGRSVIDRCNLTVLFEAGQEDTAEFLATNRVKVIASLPCYSAENVDAQRGRGVFERSIAGLRRLNRLGYGQEGSPLELDLVYNPLGPALPPPQAELEARYRRELRDRYGIEFHRLLTLTNMPIRRFARRLEREGRLAEYLELLEANFNPATVGGLMCRELVSVDYRGRLFDCDFNQMLELPLAGRPRSVWEIERFDEVAGLEVATASHCFGCTAGAGSSCGGALA